MTNLKSPPFPDGPSPQIHLTHLPPIPTYEESLTAPRPTALQILGATWGGVTVTPDIQSLIGDLDNDTLTLDLRSLHRRLRPDPAPGTVKVLTVLYRFGDDEAGQERLLVVSEDAQTARVVVDRGAAAAAIVPGRGASGRGVVLHGKLGRAWRAGERGEVEIVAAVFGPRRVEDPAVLVELGEYFEGRRRQVRMTNDFFGSDPWPFKRKSWTVYFRFVGSKRVQVVTGWEDGALEVPWSRDW